MATNTKNSTHRLKDDKLNSHHVELQFHRTLIYEIAYVIKFFIKLIV